MLSIPNDGYDSPNIEKNIQWCEKTFSDLGFKFERDKAKSTSPSMPNPFILALTIPTSLLILLSKIRNKPLKSCGESCECIDEEQLGCDASSDYRFSNN